MRGDNYEVTYDSYELLKKWEKLLNGKVESGSVSIIIESEEKTPLSPQMDYLKRYREFKERSKDYNERF